MNTNFVTRPDSKILETLRVPGNVPPVRAYIHQTGFRLFDNSIDVAKDYLKATLNENQSLFGNLDYMIAILWGCEPDSLMMDIVGCPNMGCWPENKGTQSFIMENGVYLPGDKGVTCGDGWILVAKEEAFRRTTRRLDQYMDNHPLFTNEVKPF